MTQSTYASGILFTRAHKAVRTCIYETLEKYDLNPSYWSILGITGQASEGIRLAAVAKQMDVKAPLVTMLANELIEKDLITRVPHHTDGRAKLLGLTSKGKKLTTQIEIELDTQIKVLLTGASEQDITGFQRTLEVIIDNATKLPVTE